MKSESNIYPEQVCVEPNGDVILNENIIELQREEQTYYSCDSYRVNVTYRDGLEELIKADFDNWLSYAKAKEIEPKPLTPSELATAQNRADTDYLAIMMGVEL